MRSADPKIRRQAVEFLKKGIRAAKELGGLEIGGVLYSNWPTNYHGDMITKAERYERRQRSVDCLREAMRVADEIEMPVNLEVINRYENYTINTVAEGLALCEEIGSRYCNLLLDVFHMNIEEEELWNLHKIDHWLQGHPDMHKIPGINVSVGSLGQGVSIAMGMALAGKYQKKDYKVYALIGDGESQEGMVWESAMAAAHYKLDNFTVLLDHNGLQIDGTNEEVMSIGDVLAKFKAFGFTCYSVDGHDVDAISANRDRPSSCLRRTV